MDFYDNKQQVFPRPKPMKLLVLGLPRTGTTSICEALKLLGLKSYHWNEVLSNKNNGHLQLWLEAMYAKYDGNGRLFKGEDFDQMLWDYDCVSDEPCCFFVEELITAYPEAKVILTIRTPESWVRSMRKSILEILSWRFSWKLLSYFDRDFTALYWSLLNRTTSVLSLDLPAYKPSAYPALLQSFNKHNEHVRSVVPPEKLLEFHPSQGWGPLCDFLNISKPGSSVKFPHMNEPDSLVQLRKRMYWSRWFVVAQRMGMMIWMIVLALFTTLWMAWILRVTGLRLWL